MLRRMPPLADWANFYVIIGSSAAALSGPQFVVIALGAEANAFGGEREVLAATAMLLLYVGIHNACDAAVNLYSRRNQS